MKRHIILLTALLLSVTTFAGSFDTQLEPWNRPLVKRFTPAVSTISIGRLTSWHDGVDALVIEVMLTEAVDNQTWYCDIAVETYFKVRTWPRTYGWGQYLYSVPIAPNQIGNPSYLRTLPYGDEQFHMSADGYHLDPSSYWSYGLHP